MRLVGIARTRVATFEGFGAVQGDEAEEGPEGGQAGIAGAHTIVAVLFEIVEERKERGGLEVGQAHGDGLQMARPAEEAEQ